MQGRAEVRDWPLESGGCRLWNAARPGEHHRPRGPEGAQSVRVSCMWNAAASWPGDVEPAGYGQRVPGPKGSPRGSGESVERTMNVTSAPAGTVDAAASVVVNGPRDFPEDWDQVNWARVEEEVRRLRQRIFTASRAGEHRKVRNLQRLMLRSRANALLSTRRVAQVNQGRRTPGIDGRTALSGPERAELARWLQQHGHRSAARAVRRVYIPKGNGKRRPLGIPTVAS